MFFFPPQRMTCVSVSASFCVSLPPTPPPPFPQKVFLKRGGEKCPRLFPLFQP